MSKAFGKVNMASILSYSHSDGQQTKE